jgi:hypothetical protein
MEIPFEKIEKYTNPLGSAWPRATVANRPGPAGQAHATAFRRPMPTGTWLERAQHAITVHGHNRCTDLGAMAIGSPMVGNQSSLRGNVLGTSAYAPLHKEVEGRLGW